MAQSEITPEHVILVAFVVEGGTREEAHATVLADLPGVDDLHHAKPYINSWWVAEDDRTDRSDNDSAVFVKPGLQRRAQIVLGGLDFSDLHNLLPAGRPNAFERFFGIPIPMQRGIEDQDVADDTFVVGQ